MKVSEELKNYSVEAIPPFSQLRGVAACQVTETQGLDVQEILQGGAGLYPGSPLPLHHPLIMTAEQLRNLSLFFFFLSPKFCRRKAAPEGPRLTLI